MLHHLDDTIEKDYLEKLIIRQQETNSDIVLSKIIICNELLEVGKTTIPKASYDMRKIMSGESACKETIGEWKISVSGWLAKASICKSYIEKGYNNNFNGGFSDEVDQRKILLMADRVAMTEAYYFYRQQNNSIVHSTSVKFYDALIANKILFDFIITTFKDDEMLQMKMFDEYLEKVYRSQQKYYTYIKQYNAQERKHIKSLIKESYSYIKKHKPGFSTKILSTSYTIFRLYAWTVIFIVRIKLLFERSN